MSKLKGNGIMRINGTTQAQASTFFERRANLPAKIIDAVDITTPAEARKPAFREHAARPAMPAGMMLMPMLLKVQEVASRLAMDAEFANIRAQATATRAARAESAESLDLKV